MADSQLDVVIRGRDELTPELKQIESRLIRFVGFVASAISTLKLASFPITEAANLQRELANVQKTTQFTGTQIQTLTDQLAQLSLTTDTSAVDLAKIAAAAGQQGLGKEGVEGIRAFTESVARMSSVLDLSAEESGIAIGKILNIFRLLPSQTEKVSSAINQVSNNSTARAQELLNVLRRLGDAGGALNFEQSLALSGTAIDLGATPEVAGTTLSKFINAIKVRNADFAKLLKTTPELLANRTEEDAFAVFKDVMAAFERVPLVDRQKAVNKMFGGGRITSLFDKFMQDIARNPSVLQKNLDNASGGYASGQSAIKEQATVMATLVKQVDILKNSFKELGRQAGDDLLLPLTGYVAQLRMALQTPQMRAFATAVVGALREMIEFFVGAAKALAGLNINWENFIKVIQVFLAMKIGRVIAGMFAGFAGGIPLISAFTSALTGSARASNAAGEAGAAGAQRQTTAYQALRAQLALLVRDYRAAGAAAAQQAAAEQARIRQQAAERAAAASLRSSQPNLNRSQVAIRQQQAALDAAIINSQAVRQQGGRDIQNATAAGQLGVNQVTQAARARQEAAEVAHQQRMEAIRQKYVGSRTAVLKAARDVEYAAEQTHYNRQMAALKAAGTKQVANAQASAAALLAITTNRVKQEIAAEEAKVAAQNRLHAQSRVAAAIAASNAAQLARIAANNAAGNVPATPNPNGAVIIGGAGGRGGAAGPTGGGAAGAAGAAGTLANRLAGIAGAAAGLFNVSRALTLVGTAMRFCLSALGPLYLGFILISTAIDAIGGEKIIGFFRGLTDALGFTSNATRKLAQEKKDLREKLIEEEKAVNDLVSRYRELKDATGQISPDNISKVENQFKGATSTNDIMAGATQLGLMLEGSNAELKRTEKQLADAPTQLKTIQVDVATAKKNFEEARIALEEFQKKAKEPTSFAQYNVSAQLVGNQLQNEFNKQKDILDKAVAQVGAYGPQATAALRASLPALQAAVNQARAILGGLLTNETSDFFNKVAPQVLAAKQEIEKLKAPAKGDGTSPNASDPLQSRLALATAARDKATTEEAKDAAQKEVEVVQATLAAKEAAVSNTLATLQKKVQEFRANQGIPGTFVNSFEYATSLLNLDAKTLANYVDANKNRTTPNTASLVNPLIAGRPKPDRPFSVGGNDGKGSAESEARRLAKARSELEKAELEARFNLQKQFNEQFLAEEQRLYDNGLLALKDYYAGKQAIDEINLSNEIALKNAEIQTKQKELTTPEFKASDRVRVQAEIVALEGQKKVLEAKVEEIPKAAQEAVRKAVKEFNESTLTEKLEIMQVMGVSDFSAQLGLSLDLATSQMQIKLERFKTELKNETPGIDQAFIDAFRLNGLLKAVDPVLQSIANKAELTVTRVQNALRRIDFNVATGRMTDREAERASNNARAVEAEAVRQRITEIESVREATIEKIAATEGATDAEKEATMASLRASDAYQKQENEIESLKQQYIELKTVVDETALSINKGIGDGLTKAIKSFADGTGGSLKQILLGFGKDINDTILNSITKDLSQTIMQSLNSTGTEGIGGWFSKLFNPDGVGGGASALVSKDLLGRNAGNAMYVQVVNGTGSPLDKLIESFDPKKEILERADTGFVEGLIKSINPPKEDGETDVSELLDFMKFDGQSSPTGNADIFSKELSPNLSNLLASTAAKDAEKAASEGAQNLFASMTTSFQTGLRSIDTMVADFGNRLVNNTGELGVTLGDSVGGIFGELGGLISEMGTDLTDTMSKVFEGISKAMEQSSNENAGEGSGFMSFFSNLFSNSGSSSSGSSSGGGGMDWGSIISIIASFFHTGGVVGSGMPQRTGAFSPSLFSNAVRYHTGGIAGLQPDEVPSILKKGEEVLTANDPRHRSNGGMEAAGGSTINAPVTIHVSTPDANSFRRSQDQIALKAGLAFSRALSRNT